MFLIIDFAKEHFGTDFVITCSADLLINFKMRVDFYSDLQ